MTEDYCIVAKAIVGDGIKAKVYEPRRTQFYLRNSRFKASLECADLLAS